MKKYYEAYDERYRAMHGKGLSWASDVPSLIVTELIAAYHVDKAAKLLEIGCGEGRDAKAVIENGYDLTAADISPEAIAYCKKIMPEHAARFAVCDCLSDVKIGRFDFIYSVAVLHMLVDDGDRRRFYEFIKRNLEKGGLAVICTMGDGEREFATDTGAAFDIVKRQHPSGEVMVAGTTCRVVSFDTFEREIAENGFIIVEKGLAECPPEFDVLMYAVVRAAGQEDDREAEMDYQDVNAETIDRWIEEGWEWGKPIPHEEYAEALAGRWNVLLTPTKPVPHEWFGELRGKKLLGLASGGGQQMPVFAALGAECTVFDYSRKQLESERMVAEREGYSIRIIRGDMTKPLPFADGEFDLIFHPVSNSYIREVEPVFRECFRVLKPGGRLLCGLDNGINFLFDGEDETTVVNRLPFDPIADPELMEQLVRSDCGVQFSHTMEEQIGGQLRAGFILRDIYEDTNGEGRLHELNIPSFIATLAEKPL